MKLHNRLARNLTPLLIIFFTSLPAAAQGFAQDCRTVEYLQPTIDLLKSDNNDQRVSAARTLVDSWKVSLPSLMRVIEQFDRLDDVNSWTPLDKQYATLVTETIKTILVSTNLAIQAFRQCDNDKVIKTLSWWARSDERALRVNSANILANVVDNTTICFVLHHLRDPKINVPGRANLLGVTVAVASYAYSENVDAIKDTLNILKTNLGNDAEALPQTRQLMAEIGNRIDHNSNKNAQIPDALGSYCKKYTYTGTPPR